MITLKQVPEFPSKKIVQNILIPSEERKISMFPMSYEEFLWETLEQITTAPVLFAKIIYRSKKTGRRGMNRKPPSRFPSIYAGWRNATGL
ncbi:MAG: hypothetical protein ACLTC8_02090 [Lachnospiraceae bacterium]